jgi:DUF2993 family protein
MRRDGGSGRTIRLLAWAAGGVLLLLALLQLLLPRIAASRISARIGKYGHVDSVNVSAWPALELLWGDADSVHVRAGRLELGARQLSSLLGEAHGAHDLDVSATEVRLGTLSLSGARLTKRGRALSATALASEASVRAALPPGLGVQLLSSQDGQVKVRASGGLFGVSASVDAVALASEGKLIAHPLGFLIEGLRITLFADDHVRVTGVGASVASEQPRVYRLTIAAELR